MGEAKGLIPCRKCQERHQKCDNNLPQCRSCERLGETCVRNTRALRFKHGSSARYDARFKRDQVWMKNPRHSKVQYVDETPELRNYYSSNETIGEFGSEEDIDTLDSPQIVSPTQDLASRGSVQGSQSLPQLQINNLIQPEDEVRPIVPSFDAWNVEQTFSSPPTDAHSPVVFRSSVLPQVSGFTIPQNEPLNSSNPSQAVEEEYRRLADTAAAAIPDVESGLLSPEVWRKQFFWPNSYTTTQCACLMRYYIEELAPWFDVCDPVRHFAMIVPQMARRCPPLLNAIFTAAARHLSLTLKYKASGGHVNFHGVILRNLTSESAIRYHNACLAYLIELSTDPKHVGDEDLLAAVAILQYYEELDSWLTGNNPEALLDTLRLFIDAQARASQLYQENPQVGPTAPYNHAIYAGLPNVSPSAFRRASLRVALRHDIIAAFVRQRPVRLPLEAWAFLRSFEETEDAIWTDRMAIICADVLQFCFGNENGSGEEEKQRWSDLKELEKLWERYRPLSFGPIHYQEARRINAEQVFPQIWYLSEYHAVGVQYLNLARILLAVYDPTLPRLGHGASVAHRRMVEDLRTFMLRICGIAVSNQQSQATLVLAAVAASVCGEHLTDHQEQTGVLGILEELENKYAWQTSKTIRDLQQAWSWGVVFEASDS